jgi:endonuclease YncB( thermonuclease family)
MALGVLEVSGTIDLSQFWPEGTADADTTKILVAVGANAFRFRPTPADAFRVTHAFENTEVVGTGRKAPISDKGIVTVRLQGVDAPELHYRPPAALKRKDQSKTQHDLYLTWNLEYRQHFGESATVALRQHLNAFGADPLPCIVRTSVDAPRDAFDTYGRLVGDVVVGQGPAASTVNHWLVAQGWAVPTFYTSMSEAEINGYVQLAAAASATPKRAIWRRYSRAIVAFDWDLVFRGTGAAPDPAADRGPVMLPKLFRRQSAYHVNRRARMVTGSFDRYLSSKKDEVHELSDFLTQGPQAAPVRHLHEFVRDGTVTVAPHQLVFREKPSTLRGPAGDVDWWDEAAAS